jgi:hypothetical protein
MCDGIYNGIKVRTLGCEWCAWECDVIQLRDELLADEMLGEIVAGSWLQEMGERLAVVFDRRN